MASTSAMVRPPTAPGAPGSGGKSPPRPPPPPPPRRPPPPKQQQQHSIAPKSPKSGIRPPPPPPPPRGPRPAPPPKRSVAPSSVAAASPASTAPSSGSPAHSLSASSVGSSGSSAAATSMVPVKRLRRTFQAPVVLRDVNVFERMHQVGEGTYGSVFVGKDKQSGEIVALKRINTKQEETWGFPVTAIREVKILKALKHDNIVKLQEIVTSKEQGGDIPKNVFMVFEYLEYDLTGILNTPEIRFTQDHLKSWAQQLLSGTHYMHKNKIIHRDLKASNLLINKKGELRIADLGLARSWNNDMKRLTNKVITLWYRPPELLLGCLEYTDKIDMWSVGCIIVEMFRRKSFLTGKDEQTQLNLIFQTVGHPTEETWPDIGKKCKLWNTMKPVGPYQPSRLVEALKHQLPNPKWLTENAIDLIKNLMALNPDKRWSAEKGLVADFFFENPLVKTPDQLSMKFSVKSVHEWDWKKRHPASNSGKRP